MQEDKMRRTSLVIVGLLALLLVIAGIYSYLQPAGQQEAVDPPPPPVEENQIGS
jgi:hypothetical protein